MKSSVNAVIFAGGKSSRMGEDKSLLPFGSHSTLAEYQYHRLGKLFDKVYISAKEDKFDFNCTMIPDIFETSSPLVGLISVFETLQTDVLFILSVDAPFVDETIIKTLLDHNKSELDVIVAKSPSGVQPLCGIYKRSILSLAYAQLEKENHRLGDLLACAKSKFVLFEDDSSFANLNHPKEYRLALSRLKSSSE